MKNRSISMKKNKLIAFAVGTMCLSLASCNSTDAMNETGHNLTEDNAVYQDKFDWEDDPTIGKVQAGCYKRVGITKKDETYEEMLELRDIANKGYLVVCDDGTAIFKLDGEKTAYLYDEFNFYQSDDSEKTNGIPYVYIGGRLITNDGATITQYLMLSDEESESTESSMSLPSRSYFENLDRDSSLEEIIEQIGNCGYEGSGIIYHVWVLDDGSKAELVFNSKGEIEFIYIVKGDTSERIFDRDNS